MDSFERQIRERYAELAIPFGLPDHDFPYAIREADGTGAEHVDYDEEGHFALICTERGKAIGQRVTDDLDELMYWIFRDAAFSRAQDFELANRVSGQDSRRILFAQEQYELARISADWRDRCAAEQAELLATYPFQD